VTDRLTRITTALAVVAVAADAAVISYQPPMNWYGRTESRG
jgi:hypothetical protein